MLKNCSQFCFYHFYVWIQAIDLSIFCKAAVIVTLGQFYYDSWYLSEWISRAPFTNTHYYNYADDNSMSNACAKIDELMINLKLDSKIAITWFIDNGMEPHPEKFQFMVMSNNVIDTHTLELDDTTRLRSQSDVVLLGIKIDDKLTFAKHVSAICTKASKQLNAFTRISKFLSYDSKKLVINSFINSNFQYSPLVWHFCGHVNNNKIEKIRERSLRILHRDYDSSYEVLEKGASPPPFYVGSALSSLRYSNV